MVRSQTAIKYHACHALLARYVLNQTQQQLLSLHQQDNIMLRILGCPTAYLALQEVHVLQLLQPLALAKPQEYLALQLPVQTRKLDILLLMHLSLNKNALPEHLSLIHI